MIQGYRRYKLMSATEERLVIPEFPPWFNVMMVKLGR